MENYIGKRIEGRYELHELIGVGGMANVYKATDVTDGKTVAVKILREEFYENEEFLRRFKNESKAIALLHHPNIIEVYDVCFGRSQSIVMEYVDGITLKEYLGQQGALPWKEALHFTVQILRALSHAHQKGIVHRDVKPQNVLLLEDGTLRITDFGIARFARSEARTLTDRAIGSVHYISPEQARGEHTDQRADLYSVGVMLFEMLTGQLPFDDDSPVSVALKQIQLDAPALQSIDPQIPAGLEDITARAMEKNPELRYPSADTMLRDIETFKKNPTAHFEYQYLHDEELARKSFQKAVHHAKNAPETPQRVRKDDETARSRKPERKQPRRPREWSPEEDDPPRGGSVLMVLAGITAAFVVITLAFIGIMLYTNNPLEKVPDTTVPSLLGLRYDAVKNASEFKDFLIEVEETQYNDIYERGQIIDQNPKTGKTVKVGATIKVTLSNGKKIVEMPNLLGREETSAYRELAGLELEYQKVDVFSELTPGTVAATDPGPGSEVAAGTVVRVHVSMGPENKVVEVPNVLGRQLAEARTMIEAAGLEVGGISYVINDKPYGTVVAQDPAATSLISKGSLVNLNVSGGEQKQNIVQLSIKLPEEVTEVVKLQAMHNGAILKEDRMEPAVAKYWRPAFEGTGSVTVFILYNDFLYMTIQIDFNTGNWVITEDNTAAHLPNP